MVFSSVPFLFYFLPIVLISYFLIPQKFKNLLLLLSSLFFYFYGEPKYILLLLFSIIFNYGISRLIEKNLNTKKAKYLLIFSMLINFGFLFYFKYFNFFLDNLNQILPIQINFVRIILPIGISFFTFQATSYVIDVYRGHVKSAASVFHFATYLSLFPQLVAGPIVRYETISNEITKRKFEISMFSKGVKRFIIGLAKKVLIANILGEFVLALASMQSQSVLSYWLQAISNALQIYFDFSGYSDMAIGMGFMFGFTFLENFNYPFITKSITDFWRRWHISLSSWFKDYVYIPLGGSRKGKLRNYINIFIVWMTTGLWHGANWNFVLWGLYFAIFLIIEKLFLLKSLQKHPIIGNVYTIFFVVVSFVIFSVSSVTEIGLFLSKMFGFQSLPFLNFETLFYLKNFMIIFIIAVIASTPWIKNWLGKMQNTRLKSIIMFLEPMFYFILFLVSIAFIVDASFNPFLYFRF